MISNYFLGFILNKFICIKKALVITRAFLDIWRKRCPSNNSPKQSKIILQTYIYQIFNIHTILAHLV